MKCLPIRKRVANFTVAALLSIVPALVQTGQAVVATGGNVTTNYVLNGTNYRAHIFTTLGTTNFTVTTGGDVEVLVVAGGGGGGQTIGGGGGAGGFIYSNLYAVSTGDYTVVVGAGGAGALAGGSYTNDGGKRGSNSVFGTLTAYGGGGGGSYNNAANGASAGGSGGGLGAGRSGGPMAGTNGQGYAGGVTSTNGNSGAGGGGAGAPGSNGVSGVEGAGGAGLPCDLSGDSLFYAGGGGGGARNPNGGGGGTGGTGGGGSGSRTNGADSVANTGGGGGGGGYLNSPVTSYPGGRGGSGIVIVRYEAGMPRITNLPATNITSTTASLRGDLGWSGSTTTIVTAYWGLRDGGTNAANWANTNQFADPQDVGLLSNSVSPLASDSTYYFTFCASNAYGVTWAAPSENFVTSEIWIEKTTDGGEWGPSPGIFTVHRASTATNEALTVSYSVTGSASNGVDYASLTGTVVLLAGADQAAVVVTPLPDLLFEPAETVTLTLTDGPYLISSIARSATLSIEADDTARWPHHIPITVTGYAPPAGESPLTSFPLLVRFGTHVAGFDYSQFRSAPCGDLRFSDEAGMTELPYEIESWNTNGTSYAWVRVPVLTNNASVRAMWGRSGLSAPAYTTNGMAWDASYIGVWHMAQASAQDSTSNRLNGTAAGAVTQTPGVANGADAFNSSAQYIQVPTSPRYTLTNPSYTVSAWINVDKVTNTYAGILGTYSPGFILALTNNTDRHLSFYSGISWFSSLISIPTGAWKQVAYTRNGTNGAFYVDGVRVRTVANANAATNSSPLRLGQGGTNWAPQHFMGQLDEVRLSGTERSPNWMWANWMNMASNGSFAGSGSVLGAPGLYNSTASNITTTSADLRGALTSVGQTNAIVFVYWGLKDGGTNAAGWASTNQFAEPMGIAPVSTNVSGLTSNATYYYTYCASNAYGVSWATPSAHFITGELRIERTADAREVGLVPGTFTVYRAGTATNEDLTIAYIQTGGTAVPGTHFESLSGSLLLPAGADSGTIVVTPIKDWIDQTDKTLQLTLTDALAPFGPLSNAELTIINEPPPDWPTNTWIRPVANGASASISSNWSLGHAPTNGEIVYLGPFSLQNMTWDVTNDPPAVPGGWVQSSFYSGTVTFATRYPGQGAFTNFTIAGDCLIEGGIWTHPANTGGATAKERLAVTVSGNFTLGTGAAINLTGKGYASATGPGAGNALDSILNPGTIRAASHGGVGPAYGAAAKTYDTSVAPTDLGSGGFYAGGGSLELRVDGVATIDGIMVADGLGWLRKGNGAGGSILIVAGGFAGSGTNQVNGGGADDTGDFGGGGGRMALIATNSDSFGSLVLRAFGGDGNGADGAAGTIYLERQSDGEERGTLIVNNNVSSSYTTPLPADLDPVPAPELTSELLGVSLVVSNTGRASLSRELRMGDLRWMDPASSLHLLEHTLYLTNSEHAYGNGTVASNFGGRILWGDAPPSFLVEILPSLNGDGGTNKTGVYAANTNLDLIATPDEGYGFVQWEGTVPANQKTNTSISLTVTNPIRVRAIFGSIQPGLRTWVGFSNALASVAANWHPAGTPTNGDAVLLNTTSGSNLTWDLDVPLSSWTQAGYSGVVTILTRYPSQGTFTNLAISGDCVLSNGTWTHPANSGGGTARERLSVTVGGDFILGTGAVIDVSGRGFASYQGPGAGVFGQRSQSSAPQAKAASHGGVGSYATAPGTKCYGSLTAPDALGSGAGGIGGGSVRLTVAGSATLDGTIRANAGPNSSQQVPANAGGSVYVKAGAVAGIGLLEASGSQAYWPGGGGRVALIATNALSLGAVRCAAQSGLNSATSHGGHGAPGTIYLETAADGPGHGRLIVDPQGRERDTFTELPPPVQPVPSETHATLVLTNLAYVAITTNTTMGDLFIRTNTASRLYLQGNTLTLRSAYHGDWGHSNWVVYSTGKIIWSSKASVLILR